MHVREAAALELRKALSLSAGQGTAVMVAQEVCHWLRERPEMRKALLSVAATYDSGDPVTGDRKLKAVLRLLEHDLARGNGNVLTGDWSEVDADLSQPFGVFQRYGEGHVQTCVAIRSTRSVVRPRFHKRVNGAAFVRWAARGELGA